MALISEGATVGLGVSILARLHGVLSPGAHVTVGSLSISGALGKPFQIKNVRMLTPTRVRIDFERPVNNDDGLADIRNYTIQNSVGSVPLKILSVDVPNEFPAHFVTLIVSPATRGTANYILSVNSGTLMLGPEIMVDGSMEAAGTTAWIPDNATVTKQAGDPGELGGDQVLQVVDIAAGVGDAQQQHDLSIGAYRVSGQVRSTDGLTAPFLDILPASGPPTTIFSGTNSTAWASFQRDFSLTTSGLQEIRLGSTEVTGHPTAQFDNISLRKWISTRDGITLITAADDGTPVDSTPQFFDGLGNVPHVLAAIATSLTSGKLIFDEPMLEGGDILKSTTYAFDLGLTFVSTNGLDGATLEFFTGPQVPGQLYELTINGVLFDNFLNPLAVPITTPFLGFIEKPPKDKRLNLVMYNFLLKAIRNEDVKSGLFLKRYLDGPQLIWDNTVESISKLPNLWSAVDAPDYALPFLKRIVGWTRQYDAITNPLSSAVLRRLIASSAAFWKERGPEGSIEDILTLTTSARCYVRSWFDLRAIVGETQVGEDADGIDLWLLQNAEDGGLDPYTYDVRIVDDAGALDRALVRGLVQLTRPYGERVNIFYLAFLDQFESDGDDDQWTIGTGTVAGGVYRLVPGDGLTKVPALNALDWNNYSTTWKVRGSGKFRLFFYVVGAGDYYCLEVALQSAGSNPNTIKLIKAVASTETTIGSVGTLSVFGVHLYDNTFYSIRVEVTNGGTDVNAIRIYLDAEQVLAIEDSDQAQGSIGFQSLSGFVELSQAEVFLLPMQSELVDINS
jgi:peptidoglycan hydrolase-like protein with peptidoglycan-binding domain